MERVRRTLLDTHIKSGWAGWFRLLPSAVSAAVHRDSAEMQHWQEAVPTQHTDVATPRMQDAPV
jgi:hypothetical protein